MTIRQIIPLLFVVAMLTTGCNDTGKKVTKNEIKLSEKDNLTETSFKNGDIIFHISQSAQSKAIQLATKSEYTHCGIILKQNDEYFVFEAIQPVKLTPLNKWIARGKNKHYVVKRLKNAGEILNPEVLKMMQKIGKSFIGKDYDLTFEWNDDKIYCSELIWKIYKRGADIEIGELEKLSDFDLTDKTVKAKMKERYGNNIPLNETVISPLSIFNSELLITIKQE